MTTYFVVYVMFDVMIALPLWSFILTYTTLFKRDTHTLSLSLSNNYYIYLVEKKQQQTDNVG